MRNFTFKNPWSWLTLPAMCLLFTSTFAQRTQLPAQNYNTPMGIGIGTATPKDQLHIGVPQYTFGHVMMHAYEGDGQSGTAYLQARDYSGSTSIGLQFRTQLDGNFTDALKLYPDARLEIGASVGIGPALNIYPGRYNSGSGIVWDYNSVAIDIQGQKRITFSDAVFFTDGNVGIGTLNALDKLQIKGGIRLTGDTETDYMKVYSTATRAYLESVEDDDGMFFKSNKAKAFTFDGQTLSIAPSNFTGGMVSMIQFKDTDSGTGPMSIRYKDDGSPDLTIMGGKLGINQENPTEILDVNGVIKGTTLKVDNIVFTSSNSNTVFGTNAGQHFTPANAGNVAIGKGSASGLDNANYSVFLGYNAGTDLDHVVFEHGVNPLTAGRSVLVVNNQAQLDNPLLFGAFADNTDKEDPDHATSQGSMAQLGINTHHLVDSCALTVAGAVHIGPRQFDPAGFPRDTLYSDFLLWVERGVISENFAFGEVERWSDFVFDESYQLPALDQVEAYINENKHLPEIPSEAHVKAHGYDQHGMNTRFLQKIEELTLYVIEQNKKLAEQEKQLSQYRDLEERVKKLELLLQK